MGAGASAQSISSQCANASEDEIKTALTELPPQLRAKLAEAVQSANSTGSPSAVGSGQTVPKDDAAPVQAAPASGKEVIPADWGWPAEPYQPGYLRQYVIQYTKESQNELWDKALAERTVGGSFEDHLAEKAFANLLLNKEGTGEEKDGKDHRGVDPNAYLKGKWYRFLNAKGDCNVYVHNYTCDITATKPDNFSELTSEEKVILNKLGIYVQDLPEKLCKIYDKQKAIPIVYGSKECCEALKLFAEYAKEWELMNVEPLKKVNPKSLEDCRKNIVNAMKLGKWLMVYLGDVIPELGEKICTTKNRNTFPIGLWQWGGLNSGMVKEKIYRDEDTEGGQYVVRDGFRICVVLMYDSLMFEHSSMRKEELSGRIPNFEHMEEVRCYTDGDVKKLLDINTQS